MKRWLKEFKLDSPLESGQKITVRQAINNCHRIGRTHRRRLSRRLGLEWKDFVELEAVALKAA